VADRVIGIQSDVFRLLKATRRGMTAKEVSSALRISDDSATRKLNQLAKYRLIEKIQKKILIRAQHHKVFKWRVV